MNFGGADRRLLLGGRDLRQYRQEEVRRAIAAAGDSSVLLITHRWLDLVDEALVLADGRIAPAAAGA